MSTKQQDTITVTGRTLRDVQKRINITLSDLPEKGWAALSVTLCPDIDGGYVALILVQKAKG